MFRVFPRKQINRQKSDVGGASWASHHMAVRPKGGAALWCGQPMGPLLVSFGLRDLPGKIGTSGFGASNSENISNKFSETKNSRKQELALWHLVNMLVPENA